VSDYRDRASCTLLGGKAVHRTRRALPYVRGVRCDVIETGGDGLALVLIILGRRTPCVALGPAIEVGL
jgi:hypothetical protein